MPAPGMKKCPQCAEEIKAEALLCRYCKARFEVTRRGYCTTCHEVVALGDDDACPRGHGPVADSFLDTRLVSPAQIGLAGAVPPAPPPPGPIVPGPAPGGPYPAAQPAWLIPPTRRRRGPIIALSVIGGLILIVGVIVLVAYLQWKNDPKNQAVVVTFATIDDQADGQKVTIEGYMHLGGMSDYDRSDDQGYNSAYFLPDPDGPLTDGVGIWLPESPDDPPSPNRMAHLPFQYQYDDFRVRLNDGSYRYQDDPARLTGRWNSDGRSITVEKIEAALTLH